MSCGRPAATADPAPLRGELPAPFADLNLRAIGTMRQAFRVPVGWSDHTPGWLAPVIATSLGAAVVEKHFTTDRSRPGPDHRFALEPDELAEMVRAIRDTEAALGDGVKRRAPAEDDLYVTAVGRCLPHGR